MTDNSDTPEVPEVVGGPETPGMAGELGDLGGLLASAQQAMSAQAEAARTSVEGSAGGGMVVASVTGAQELVDLTISSEVVDPEDVEMLQDLVLAAVRQAFEAASNAASEELGGLTGGLGLGGLLG